MKRVNYNKQSGVRLRAWHTFLPITVVSIALNLVLHSHVSSAVLNKYPGDSIYTLTRPAALGLVGITSTLLIAVLLLSWFCTTKWINSSSQRSVGYETVLFILDLGTTGVAYLLMLFLAPQIFYTYYQWIFTELPVQWVVKPMSWQALLNLLSLPSGASMADHLAGFALWVLLSNTVFQWVWYRLCVRWARQ